MGCQEHVHKLGYRTNQDIQKSHLNLERLTGHPKKYILFFCVFALFAALTHAQTGTHVRVDVDRTAVGMWSIMGKAAYVDAESNDTIGIANAKLKMAALPKSSLVVESKTNQKGNFMLLKRVSKFYDKYLIKVSAKGFEDAEVTFDYQKDTSDKAANYVVEKKDVGIILLKKKNQ